jgi:hypothetical protein
MIHEVVRMSSVKLIISDYTLDVVVSARLWARIGTSFDLLSG